MTKLKITVDNATAPGGVFMAPIWAGIHDGSFDIYNQGQAASAALESLAEDGDSSLLSADFASTAPGGTDGVIIGADGVAGPIDSGETASTTLTVNNESSNRYFSYAGMLIPSNDAFVGNDDAQGIQLFDASGNFLGAKEFTVKGTDVKDAGTEVNTENDAAFINQTAPNTGVDENGTVHQHEGFIGSEGNPGGTPIILGGTNAAGGTIDPYAADFTQADFDLLNFHINVIKETTGTDGRDIIRGDASDDIVHAGEGNDIITGRDGYDELHGEEGNDRIFGQNGNDIITGGQGNDRLFGGQGNDAISGDEGNDAIYGGQGDDKIDGGLGNDRIFGGQGDDMVHGGEGNDWIFGGNGDDFLFAGKGDDTLFGGNGSDTFVHNQDDGNTTINDFNTSEDIIHLSLSGISSYADLINSATNIVHNNNYLSIEIDANNSLEIFADANITSDDFYFA